MSYILIGGWLFTLLMLRYYFVTAHKRFIITKRYNVWTVRDSKGALLPSQRAFGTSAS